MTLSSIGAYLKGARKSMSELWADSRSQYEEYGVLSFFRADPVVIDTIYASLKKGYSNLRRRQ